MTKVLILDNDKLFQHVVKDCLIGSEIVPTTANSPEAAFDAVLLADQQQSPFVIFLVDQRLGSGLSGVEMIERLRQISPETDAILFTAFADEEMLAQAYAAGAFSYLPKPFDRDQLLRSLRHLAAWRKARIERDWLVKLSEITAEMNSAISEEDVIQVIVNSSRRLGFKRSRLWRIAGDSLMGVAEDNNEGLELNFVGCSIPLAELPHSTAALQTDKPHIITSTPEVNNAIKARFPEFVLSEGMWVIVPLRLGENDKWLLALDNAQQSVQLRSEQTQLLSLFANQISAALTRSQLHDAEEGKRKSLDVLSSIMRRVVDHAALGEDLETFLEGIRREIGLVMDARTMFVVLKDQDTDELIYRLCVDCDQPRQMDYAKKKQGLVSHLIQRNESYLFKHGTGDYREKHGLVLVGATPARSWLGVMLRVADKAIGAIVLEDTERDELYDEADQQLLETIAGQIAGLIQIVRLKESEADLANLLKAAKKIAEKTTLQDVMKNLTDTVWQLADVTPDVLTVWFVDHEDQQLKLGETRGARSTQETPFQSTAKQDGTVWRVTHEKDDPVFAESIEELQGLGEDFTEREDILSAVILPLRVRNKPVGAMLLGYRQPHTFKSRERQRLRLLSEFGASAIDSAVWLETEQNLRRKLKRAFGVANATAWASNFVHNFKSEIGLIRANAYLIGKIESLPRELVEPLLSDIEQSICNMLVAFADATPFKMEPVLFDFDPWLRDAIKTLTTDVATCDPTFDGACGKQQIHFSAPALKQSLKHLIRNALEATDNKGPIIVRTRLQSAQWVKVEIENGGPAIPVERRHSLFDLGQSTKHESEGWGLLLAYGLIAGTGGELWLESSEAGRTIFAFTLPANPFVR